MELIVEDGLHATGDPALLELALQNLISNAWKFTAKQDKALIHVGVERLADGGCAFFVRDTGAGFDMRYADKLFVPFQRLHSVDDFAGTGIGLAIVGRIINRHGGRIWAEGHPEHGAVFRFVLPERRPVLREGGTR
jgi:signal transduction histidine kinase